MKAMEHRKTKRSTMTKAQTTNGVFVPSQATGEIPMQQTNSIFLAPKSDSAEFERLSDGVYDAVCIGVVGREYADFNDNTKTVAKIYFIFQITDNGATYYFKSKPCKPLIGERSNLFCMIQGWTGATYERIAERFDATKMIGYGAQLVITTKQAKDGSGREFAEIANILKPKKNVNTPVVQDAIPAYLVRGNIALELAAGITVKDEISQAKASMPQNLPGGVNSNAIPDNINDNLPGFVPQQAQAPAQKKAKAPKMPANAKVTQNANPAGFMGAQDFTVTQPAPQPAQPAVQTAQQAMVQEGIAEDDDDSDLPF